MRLKVLFTIPNFDTAGSGLALFNLASSLDVSKFDVHVLCKHNKGEFFKVVEKSHLTIHVFEYETAMRPIFKGLMGAYQVSRKLKAIKADIIYSYHYSSDYSEPLSAFLAGIKWIYVKKNMSWFGPSLNAWKLRTFFAKGINLQNSQMQREFFKESQKVVRIPIGVDTDSFVFKEKNLAFKSELNIDTNEFVFVHVSSLIPLKGLDTILDSFNSLSQGISNITLLIVGPNQTEYVQEMMVKYDSNKKIKFIGKTPQVAKYLNISDVFIQATKNEGRREGAPIALQEAMACGLICLGSRIAGIEDQLAAFDQLLFEASNAEELKSKMLSVYELSETDSKNLKQDLRNYVLENYSLKNEVRLTQEWLYKLCNKK
jgi:glycosyltransferase involved in cell wall biosynthesis